MEARNSFYLMLLIQEFKYWFNHPESLTKDDFNAIITRRNFNDKEVESLKSDLEVYGLKIK